MVMLWLCIAQPHMYTLLFFVAPTSACKRALSLSLFLSLFDVSPDCMDTLSMGDSRIASGSARVSRKRMGTRGRGGIFCEELQASE